MNARVTFQFKYRGKVFRNIHNPIDYPWLFALGFVVVVVVDGPSHICSCLWTIGFEKQLSCYPYKNVKIKIELAGVALLFNLATYTHCPRNDKVW